MGNSNSGNKLATGSTAKHGAALVSRVRGNILRAFDLSDQRGRPLSEIIYDELQANPLKVLEIAIKAMPKEASIDVSHKADADKLSDAELADIIAKRARALHDDQAIEAECHEIAPNTLTAGS